MIAGNFSLKFPFIISESQGDRERFVDRESAADSRQPCLGQVSICKFGIESMFPNEW